MSLSVFYEDIARERQRIKEANMKDKDGFLLLFSNLIGEPKQIDYKPYTVDEKQMAHTEAIIKSMTKKEREKPDIINASRKQRIAKGSGTTVEDVNKLLKQFEQVKKMMKQFSNKKGLFGRGKMPFPM